jgi:hypothetical protein
MRKSIGAPFEDRSSLGEENSKKHSPLRLLPLIWPARRGYPPYRLTLFSTSLSWSILPVTKLVRE